MKRSIFLAGAVLLASALAGGITAYTVSNLIDNGSDHPAAVRGDYPGASETRFTASEQSGYPDLTFAAESAVKAVVNIVKTEEVQAQNPFGGGSDPFFEFFGIPRGRSYQQAPAQERRSGGSGVIISPDGYIVTNNHVVDNAKELKVTLNDNTSYKAKVIGTDPTTDLAVIKIEAKDLPIIPFGDSDALRLGEWVLAIGSPYDLRSTVTAGIVSAKARNLDIIPNQFRIESFIQTDAAVNPGNSGGALVNIRGELVGINTVIKSPTGSFTGYSFAVPTSIVKKVVVDLKEYGVVQRALLGISFQEIDDDFIEREGKKTGITERGGIYVAQVDPAGAAAAAGIKSGDVITGIDGIAMNSTSQILELIAKHRPNDEVKVSVKRDGQVKQFDVVLRNRSGDTSVVKSDAVYAMDALGGKFAEIGDKDKRSLKIAGGVQVVSISPKGLLSKARVREGYIITRINDTPVNKLSDLNRINTKIESIEGVYPDGRAASYSIISE